jgi:hypothetical protein
MTSHDALPDGVLLLLLGVATFALAAWAHAG